MRNRILANIPKLIFVGGYTKSGTTFIGRTLGLFNQVCAKGELDYFRLFFKELNALTDKYNTNIEYVNREIYDGKGSLDKVDETAMVRIHRAVFAELFKSGTHVPEDSKFWVEKSPYNVRWAKSINFVFPTSTIVAVYRDPVAVLRSNLRHLADHRQEELKNPNSPERQEFRQKFIRAWQDWVAHIENIRERLVLVNYQRVVDDTQGFLGFAANNIFGEDLGLKAPIETLSKEYYLRKLEEDRRAKSLVQADPGRLILSEEEASAVKKECHVPKLVFDF